MNISNVSSPASNALAVWSAATRSLTATGPAFNVATGTNRVTIANGSSVSFAPGVSLASWLTVLGIALANVTWNLNMSNGTNTDLAQSAASGASLFASVFNINGFFTTLSNVGTVSGTYSSNSIILKAV